MTKVVVHNNNKIHTLLCGKQQLIGSALEHHRLASQVQKGKIRDYASYPFPAPLEPAKSAPVTESFPERTPEPPSKSVSKIKESEAAIQQIDSYLKVYESNQHRKAMILHHDLEENYLQPMNRRLTKKMTGRQYEDFVKRKHRAISAFDTQSKTKGVFPNSLPEIPRILMHTGDLTDPVSKYRRNAEREEQLEEVIARSTGEYRAPPVLPDRNTMNVKEWRLLAETRFYTDASGVSAKGKRIFPAKNKSLVEGQIDQFKEVPESVVRDRPMPPAAIDHIRFGEA